MTRQPPTWIATVCFPTRPGVSAAYRRGISVQPSRFNQLLVVEAGCDAAQYRSQDRLTRVVQANPGMTGVALRRILLHEIGALPGEAQVILADCDDEMLPGGAEALCQGLVGAEIVAGDMEITDPSGDPVGRAFFDGTTLPAMTADPGQLDHRNWLGLTNTALHASLLSSMTPAIPDDIVAVDWWLFRHLLASGCRARCIPEAVTRYRSDHAGTLGYGPARDLSVLGRRLHIVRQHQAATFGAITAEIMRLSSRAERDPAGVLRMLDTLPESGVWYEDVFRLAERMDA